MLSISCPHCSHELDEAELKRLFAQRNARRRWGPPTEPAAEPKSKSGKASLKTGDSDREESPPPGLTPTEKIQWWLRHDRR
jgi:hypothetical protein